MSARNYLSGREKQFKLIDWLPNINQQKFFYSSGQALPALSANTSNLLNRNINYSFQVSNSSFDNGDRCGTPFSDFFSESETGTPDFRSEESDSSTGSVLRRNTAEATKLLWDEWLCIERTIYEEDGEHTSRPLMLEECRQWRELHPHLRVVGRAIKLPEKRPNYRNMEMDETIAMNYSDHEQLSDSSDERLSQSSTDVTPQNSPRPSVTGDLGDSEKKLSRERLTFCSTYDYVDELPDTFCSLLQITPIQIHSPLQRKRLNSSIMKSDMASSRWMRNNRPDSSVNCDRNSAKSFISLDTRNYSTMALSASDRDKVMNRGVTARQRDKLEPLYTPDVPQNDLGRMSMHQLSVRKVSLPPLLLEEEKRKIGMFGSATKTNIARVRTRKAAQKSLFQIDRVKHI